MNKQQEYYDKISFPINSTKSRRSIDWRDSGIVIDEEAQFHSIEGLVDFDSYDRFNSTGIDSQRSSCLSTSEYDPSFNSTSSRYSLGTNNHNYVDMILDDADDDTILHLAVVGFTVEQVNDLVKACDINAINYNMQTPLHVATMANRPEMVKLLIDAGAILNIPDRRGNTPLHVACQKGFKEIVSIIMDSLLLSDKLQNKNTRLDIKQVLEVPNFDGKTCLHLAASGNQTQIIELLVNKYKANINSHDHTSGGTILHSAIQDNNLSLIKFILNFEQHCNEPDFRGRKPLKSIMSGLNSNLDTKQDFESMKELLHDRIISCIKNNGCCTEEQYNNEIKDLQETSSISSSDYSDSEPEMETYEKDSQVG